MIDFTAASSNWTAIDGGASDKLAKSNRDGDRLNLRISPTQAHDGPSPNGGDSYALA
jgi:hypothetical protein